MSDPTDPAAIHARALAYAAGVAGDVAAVKGAVIGETDIQRAFVIGYAAGAEAVARAMTLEGAGRVSRRLGAMRVRRARR